MAVRVAINGLGRITTQLVRVVDQGGFSDLFEIAAIHDSAGPEGIVRALRHDGTYGPFPRDLSLSNDILTIGEQEIQLSSQAEAKHASWGKSDISLVIVDGAAAADAVALDQHLKKGARKVIVPAASDLAHVNLGIGINEERYEPEAHEIVGSAAGAPSAVAMVYQLLDGAAKVRVGHAAVLAPVTGERPLLDTPALRGASANIIPLSANLDPVFDQLIGKLSNRLGVDVFETPGTAVGSISFGVWLEQRITEESVRDLVLGATQGDDLIGLLGVRDDVSASSDVLRDSRTLIVDWSTSRLLYETFLTFKGWYDAEWGAACRLADVLALICEEGVPGTA